MTEKEIIQAYSDLTSQDIREALRYAANQIEHKELI
jgi:uncharacterized protein (DUF433 family)